MSSTTIDISGGVKFFNRNKALLKDGSTVSASSNDESAKLMLDINQYTRWESLASNDLTTETITINLASTTTIDKIILVDHNFKSYTIQYDGTNDFTTVNNLDGDLVGGIVETDYDKNVSYYNFDSVSVDSITISVTTTQVVNAQKYIVQFIATEELGTLAGFPRVQSVSHDRNIKGTRAISGRSIIQKSYETTSFRMNFKTYPVQADITLLATIHDREDSFLVWLCGGRYGSDHFTVEQRGWRLQDIYNMQINRPLGANYAKGIYQNGVDTNISLIEVI